MIDRDLLLEIWEKQSCLGIPVEICYGTLEEQKEWLYERLKAILEVLESMKESCL